MLAKYISPFDFIYKFEIVAFDHGSLEEVEA